MVWWHSDGEKGGYKCGGEWYVCGELSAATPDAVCRPAETPVYGIWSCKLLSQGKLFLYKVGDRWDEF